ncbi:MAG: HU family DNA-binding protein [Candidatus Poribacteria bacterium]|nr:HU family DNA-binding protein [Candidatus Poribacteria bacterium]
MARLSKQDVASSVAESTGLSKRDATTAVDAALEAIQNALSNGDSVGLIGFGTFDVATRAPRQGRNPRNRDEIIDIPEKTVPRFKAGKGLKDACS